MEAPGRVELPTNGLGNRCSIHLSYGAEQPHYLTSIQETNRAWEIGPRSTALLIFDSPMDLAAPVGFSMFRIVLASRSNGGSRQFEKRKTRGSEHALAFVLRSSVPRRITVTAAGIAILRQCFPIMVENLCQLFRVYILNHRHDIDPLVPSSCGQDSSVSRRFNTLDTRRRKE